MKRNHSTGKSIVMAQLRKMGLTATRKTLDNGDRAWVLSDGRTFTSLREMANALKLAVV